MAKKTDPAPDPDLTPSDESDLSAASEPITVPQEVVEALGGVPIPPPPVRMPRPTVTRVGEPLPKSRPDPGGLLANPRPDRREAIKRIEAARASLSRLVHLIEEGVTETGAKIGAATANAEACEAEGFDPVRANALIEDLAAALAKHLG